jgi:PhnB protein
MKEIVTYLNFDGNCREEMTFYGKCLGSELHMTPFSEVPGNFPKEAKDRIMHARLTKGLAPILTASDTMPDMPFQQGTNFSVSVHCESMPEIERLFSAFGEKGKVTMPLKIRSGALGLGCSQINLASIGCSTSNNPNKDSWRFVRRLVATENARQTRIAFLEKRYTLLLQLSGSP